MSQEPVRYPYAEGDLLEARNTYFYTPFQGEPFLEAWAAQRDGILSAPAASTEAPASPSIGKPTDLLLDSLHAAISRDPDAGPWADLDRLLQRFEVTKRLHGEYQAQGRPSDPSDYTFLPRYLRFAEVLELAYGATGALPYLNGLLKCMDTLSALRARLQPGAMERLGALILKERAHIQGLRRQLSGGTDEA